VSVAVRSGRRGHRLGFDLEVHGPRLALIAAACVVAAILGVASVSSPLLSLALPLGVVFVAVAIRELALGVVLFTLLAFFQLIPGIEGSGLTLVKLAGLALAGVWLIMLLDRRDACPFLPRDAPVVGLGVIAFWLWGVASSLWAVDTGEVRTYVLRIGQSVLLFLIVYSALRRPEHLRWFAGPSSSPRSSPAPSASARAPRTAPTGWSRARSATRTTSRPRSSRGSSSTASCS
jgi:hypothetical protein